MIHLGMTNGQKQDRIRQYRIDNGIRKVFVLTPEKFKFPVEDSETIEYHQIILYRYFYRLMQEINPETLVVINECLRTQNRNDLTYNCIRNFLKQTHHQLIFQTLPIIDKPEDVLILIDFDTQSRYKRISDLGIIAQSTISVAARNIRLSAIPIEVSPEIQGRYESEKKKLFDHIGTKDPHTIPRNLYLISGKAKVGAMHPDRWYIGRNNRFCLGKYQTFKEPVYLNSPYTVFEFCHNFIDFSDFLALSNQNEIDVMVANLKVDHWYFSRYSDWCGRVMDVYSKIRQFQKCA